MCYVHSGNHGMQVSPIVCRHDVASYGSTLDCNIPSYLHVPKGKNSTIYFVS